MQERISVEQYSFIARRHEQDPSQILMASGNLHTHDPSDLLVDVLRRRFQTYLELTAESPHARVMLVETGSIPAPAPEETTDEFLVAKGGEQLMLTEWARRHEMWILRLEPQDEFDIPFADECKETPPDPSPSGYEVVQSPELAGIFAFDGVSFTGMSGYYGGRLIPQMVSRGIIERDAAQAYMDKWFGEFRAGWAKEMPMIQIEKFGFYFDEFLRAYRKVYGKALEFPLTNADAEFMWYETCGCMYPEQFPNGISETEVGRVAEAVTELRDKGAWLIVRELWGKGWSPFCAPGDSHVRALGRLGMSQLGKALSDCS